jgi:hypothetical protein
MDLVWFQREGLRDGVRWRQVFKTYRSKVSEKKHTTPFPESLSSGIKQTIRSLYLQDTFGNVPFVFLLLVTDITDIYIHIHITYLEHILLLLSSTEIPAVILHEVYRYKLITLRYIYLYMMRKERCKYAVHNFSYTVDLDYLTFQMKWIVAHCSIVGC